MVGEIKWDNVSDYSQIPEAEMKAWFEPAPLPKPGWNAYKVYLGGRLADHSDAIEMWVAKETNKPYLAVNFVFEMVDEPHAKVFANRFNFTSREFNGKPSAVAALVWLINQSAGENTISLPTVMSDIRGDFSGQKDGGNSIPVKNYPKGQFITALVQAFSESAPARYVDWNGDWEGQAEDGVDQQGKKVYKTIAASHSRFPDAPEGTPGIYPGLPAKLREFEWMNSKGHSVVVNARYELKARGGAIYGTKSRG